MDLSEFIQIQKEGFKRHPWELARLKILSYFIKLCNNRPSSIIDVGSGDAFLSSGIAKQYPAAQVLAVDINYTGAVLEKINSGKLQNMQFVNELNYAHSISKIDIVILMDVLEHIENPGSILKGILSLPGVTTETQFIITVPAYQKLFSQHDINLGHFRRYNLKTMGDLLQTNRLKVIKNGCFFNSLLLVRLLQLCIERIKGKKKPSWEGIHTWKGGKLLTLIITNLFWLEFKITWYLARTGIKIPGLTCYSICQPFP